VRVGIDVILFILIGSLSAGMAGLGGFVSSKEPWARIAFIVMGVLSLVFIVWGGIITHKPATPAEIAAEIIRQSGNKGAAEPSKSASAREIAAAVIQQLPKLKTESPAELNSKQLAAAVDALSGTSELPPNLLPEIPDLILQGIADNLKKRLRDDYSSYNKMDNSLFAQQHGPDQDKMREARKQLRAKVFSDNKGLFSYAKSVSDECARRPSLNLNAEAKELTAEIASFNSVPCCEAY
jgi:hypothetical protein